MDFRPIDVARAPWYRRALLPAMLPVNRLLRGIWSHSRLSRSTWFDSHLWRGVWNVNRLFACTPRRGHDRVDVRLGRVRMRLDLSRLTDVLAFCYGAGEIEVDHACALFCTPGSTVVDVGGNIGTTALAFREHVPRGRVHVFEPASEMLRALRQNLELNDADRVVVHPFGLGDAPGKAFLHVPIDGNPGSAYVDGNAGGTEVVEVRRLDDVLADEPRIDFIKIDVEGLELGVLRGGTAILRRHRPTVLFEVNEKALGRAGTSGAEVCRFLGGMGYGFRYLDGGELRRYDPAVMLERELHNVIAVHPDRDPTGWSRRVEERTRRAGFNAAARSDSVGTMSAAPWTGVLPAITTPFREDGTVDEGFLGEHAAWMVDEGCTGIVCLGSLGEGATLAVGEKEAVLAAVVAAVGERVPVLAAVSALSTAEAVHVAGRAAALGCAGLMVLPPYAHRGDGREVRTHFQAVFGATELPCMLYNNPAAYGADVRAPEIAGLAASCPNLVALKESGGDVRRITAVRALLGDRIACFAGLDDMVLEACGVGAVGWVGGVANALPGDSVRLFGLAREGRRDEAMDLGARLLPLLRMDTVPGFVQLIKLMQQEVGRGSERVRPPRLPLEGRARETALDTIRSSLAALGHGGSR